MIQGFADDFTRDIYDGAENARTRSYPAEAVPATLRELDLLNAAHALSDLRVPPGNRLEALKGNLKGFHSIRINQQWRIVFRWTSAGPADVKITDYH